MIPALDAKSSGGAGPARWRAAVLVCLGLATSPHAAPGDIAPCPEGAVCKQSSSSPAADWFRHGIEALADDEREVAACALERASQLDPAEDGRSLSSFVKPLRGGVKPLPRDCVSSPSPLDRKKYFPRLYLAKAYLESALRSQGAEKSEFCRKALQSLADSRQTAPLAKVREQWERREKVGTALQESRCCDIIPQDAQCPASKGGGG